MDWTSFLGIQGCTLMHPAAPHGEFVLKTVVEGAWAVPRHSGRSIRLEV